MRKSAFTQRSRAGEHLLLDVIGLCLLAAGLAGCGTVDNPAACRSVDDSCPTGQRCNVATQTCIPGGVDTAATDGRVDGRDGGGGSDGGPDTPGGDAPEPPVPTDAGTDVGTEAPGSCTVDEHCTTDGLERCEANRCVACRVNDDCSDDRPWCSPEKTCETCTVAMAAGQTVCTGAKAFCDPASARCSECLASADCKDTMKPTCGPAKTCVPCTEGGGDAACLARNPASPRCSGAGATSGTCVQCSSSMDCKAPATPICVNQACVACTTDAQCASRDGANPGLCLVKSGRCARADEVVYVKNVTGCSMAANAGTFDVPACDPATGIARTTPTRNVLLLRGPTLDRLRVVGGTGPLFVFGQEGASIFPGVGRGIEVTVGREVHVQGVTVAGGAAEGVVVEGPGILRLNRSTIKNNAKGGLVARLGAGYEISNSIFDGNGPGISGQPFGGVLLEPSMGGRPAVFRYNTVVGNQGPGVVCDQTTQVLYGVLFHDNVLLDKVNCDSRSGVEVKLPNTPGFMPGSYRIMAGSPCHDLGDMTNFPLDDMDGDVRPAGTRSDCGADEYVAP